MDNLIANNDGLSDPLHYYSMHQMHSIKPLVRVRYCDFDIAIRKLCNCDDLYTCQRIRCLEPGPSIEKMPPHNQGVTTAGRRT